MFVRGQKPCAECHLWLCTCPTPTEPDCATVEDDPRTIELVEADVRRVMAQHAAILDRGWQTQRDRLILHQLVDRLLDEYAILLEIDRITQ